jgi:hypothetical protein
MSNTIRIRITKRCMIDRDKVGEPGMIVELDVVNAAGMLAGGHAAVDPVACAEAIKNWNAGALRVEAKSRGPEPHAPMGWLLPSAATGYAVGRFH